MSAVDAALPGVPWIAIRQDKVLARLTLEVIERLEQIDQRLGVTTVEPKELTAVKKELASIARRR